MRSLSFILYLLLASTSIIAINFFSNWFSRNLRTKLHLWLRFTLPLEDSLRKTKNLMLHWVQGRCHGCQPYLKYCKISWKHCPPPQCVRKLPGVLPCVQTFAAATPGILRSHQSKGTKHCFSALGWYFSIAVFNRHQVGISACWSPSGITIHPVPFLLVLPRSLTNWCHCSFNLCIHYNCHWKNIKRHLKVSNKKE